ncbi:DUF1376 domain-containing protein [Tropicimonas sp. IMCC34011]|uniref:YdaU family protein n=1 Tax=Tropicimonas sp. IMCC34011 TaxID=2248759 RepID=UPI000E27B060|nr:DUF1376 domain-containing protein [Tropicimonas sp. IMCC34011]
MSEQPFMQLYVGDYLADTLDLTTEEHGAYLLLLMTMWRHNGKLPNDHRKLARIARVHPPKWKRVWAGIEHFFVVSGDVVTNRRLAKEMEKARLKSASRAEAGAKGGRAKALKNNEQAEANATGLPKHSSEVRDQTEKEEPIGSSKKRGSRLTEDWRLPLDWGRWAVEQGMDEFSVRREADRFRDYWIGVSGKNGAKLDWLATWRNWIRKALDDRQAKTDRHQPVGRQGYVNAGAFGMIPEVG